MAKKVYGTTPWGKELLDVIEYKTDSGRLGRGKTYANTDKVYNIKILKNSITAKVTGNYDPYYNVNLKFKIFSDRQIQNIKDILDKQPLLLASIMNGVLPNEFLKILKENNILLFSDFNMHCNCYDFYGDYACKHVSGLYYITISEIDKDPFILFSLKGFDLVEYYGIKSEINIQYPLKLEFITQNDTICIEQNNEVDIIKLIPNKNFILCLLESNPPFAPIDYKEVLEQFYKKITRELSWNISPIHNEKKEKIQRLFQNSDFEFILNHNIYESDFIVNNRLLIEVQELFEEYKEIDFIDAGLIINTLNLFKLFISFEDDNGTPTYRYLFYLFRSLYFVLESNSFIPCVIENKDSFSVAYKPMLSNTDIKKQIDILSNICPLMAKYKSQYLTNVSTTQAIMSATLSDYVANTDFMHTKLKNNPPKISHAFFKAAKIGTKEFENKNLAKSIYNYFAIFDITNSVYEYKIYIDKSKQYNLSIKVQYKDDEYFLNDGLEKLNKMEILKFISFLTSHLPEIKELLNKEKIYIKKGDLEQFLLTTSTIVSNLGIGIVLPKELKNLLKPKISLKVSSSSKSYKSFFTLDSMLEYDWQIAIGDTIISVEEFEKLISSGKELVEFRDNFVVISALEAKNIFTQINKKKKLTTFDLLQAKLNNEVFIDKDLEKYIDDILTPKNIDIPNSLNATLREYQQRGVLWNINNLLNGFGTILADDMGLGKTIQAIASILYLKENKKIEKGVLVVVPTTLLNNWENELDKFAPSLNYFSFYGLKRVMQDADILITTYDIVRRDLEALKKKKFDCIIIDEAQKIKNASTQIAIAVKSIKSKYKIALSGTPVENNLSELWSIFDFALPKYLKTLKEFNTNFAKDIEIKKDKIKIEKLKNITAPFMLRRLKSDKQIAKNLPNKIVTDEYVTMSKKQASLYQSVVDDSFEKLKSDEGTKGLILKLIITLKQICNHPRNYDKKSECDASLSGKSELLLTLLDTILQRDEKVLIFTQYVEMGNILVDIIQKTLLTTPLFLQGSLSKKKRDELIDKFQNDSKYKIFILSLKAGGVGLNLTQANHVIHYDLWFNPAVENQATDRAFRIGQEKNVSVYRFITKNSFEEKIDKMIKSKQELSDLSVSIGENWLGDMDNDELKSLFEI